MVSVFTIFKAFWHKMCSEKSKMFNKHQNPIFFKFAFGTERPISY